MSVLDKRSDTLDSFVDMVAAVRARKKVDEYRKLLYQAARVEPTYENPLGMLGQEAEAALDVSVEKSKQAFEAAEKDAVWNKLFRLLVED